MSKGFKVAIIGGGSTYTLGMVGALIAEKDIFPLKELTFFDIDSQRQTPMAEATKIILQEQLPNTKFFYTDSDKKTAYQDADFVFVQIREGGLAMRGLDEKIPLKHGVVGQETCGPGGMAYGLRSIGAMFDIVRDIRKYAPEAWIINYTNPAAIVAIALNKEFPNDKKIFNLCDMPLGMLENFGQLLDMHPRDFVPEYYGLNHYGWFCGLRDKQGNDLMSRLGAFLEKGVLTSDISGNEILQEKVWIDTFQQLFVMGRDMPGAIPNTYHQYYLYPKKMVSKMDAHFTRADEVIAHREKREFAYANTIISQGSTIGHEVKSDLHGRYMVQVVASLANNSGGIYIVIVPNNGTIACLPDDAMVEVDCLVDQRGPRPFNVPHIPLFHQALLQNQYAVEKLTVDAWYSGCKQTFIEALVLNRTVIDFPLAQVLAEEILEANKKWIPQFFK
ncbi:MAG: 6-phospho-alpha-glucosidase [Brevinema sp.]